MSSSLFAGVEMAPRDPILGVTEAFNADPNPNKVNLGRRRLLRRRRQGAGARVRAPRRATAAGESAAAQLSADRRAPTTTAPCRRWFSARTARRVKEGASSPCRRWAAPAASRSAPICCGGSIRTAEVWISDPSWENHRALFENAGFKVNTYPYYDAATHGLDFAGMLASLQSTARGLDRGAARVLPQPDRRRSDAEQWDEVIEIVKARGLVPFLDIAYQGFADGLDADAARRAPLRQAGVPLFVSSSFSKSLSLYGERVGALSVVAAQQRRSGARAEPGQARDPHQLLESADARRQDRRDGAHDARAALRCGSRSSGRCATASKTMRRQLVGKDRARRADFDFSFVDASSAACFRTPGCRRSRCGACARNIRSTRSTRGRICVAALNSRNIDYVAEAIARVGQVSRARRSDHRDSAWACIGPTRRPL